MLKIGRQQTAINVIFWANVSFLGLSTLALLVVEHVTKNYNTYTDLLLVTVFIEILVNLAAISFALARIYKKIWKISELRVNRVLMLLHLGMFLAFAVLFLIEYAVYFNLAFTKAIVEDNVKLLSILFILKQIFGLAIYLLLLFMLVKIVSPLSYVTLKMD